MKLMRTVFCCFTVIELSSMALAGEKPAGSSGTRVYENRLTPVKDPKPILADYPQFVEPVHEVAARFEAPMLVDDPGADLSVRAWRFSYNARGIIEVPNRLRGDRTAVIVVHPWGIDDGQGWRTPEPAGVAFQCTPAKNKIVLDHGATVINPFLKAMRDKVGLVAYSLPGTEDPIRKKLYRSFRGQTSEEDRRQGQRELEAKLAAFPYRGETIPSSIAVSEETPALDYFARFPGIDSGPGYEGKGFWQLPIPVMKPISVALKDVVIYDAEGYPLLRDFLKAQGIRHVLLTGYNTDMCVCSTTAGYKNLARDFDVFLVGDATIATFPAQPTPRYATNQAVCYAALDLLITQVSWVQPTKVGEVTTLKAGR
jgi:Isochorismatase family